MKRLNSHDDDSLFCWHKVCCCSSKLYDAWGILREPEIYKLCLMKWEYSLFIFCSEFKCHKLWCKNVINRKLLKSFQTFKSALLWACVLFVEDIVSGCSTVTINVCLTAGWHTLKNKSLSILMIQLFIPFFSQCNIQIIEIREEVFPFFNLLF